MGRALLLGQAGGRAPRLELALFLFYYSLRHANVTAFGGYHVLALLTEKSHDIHF